MRKSCKATLQIIKWRQPVDRSGPNGHANVAQQASQCLEGAWGGTVGRGILTVLCRAPDRDIYVKAEQSACPTYLQAYLLSQLLES
ncbi:hypothetical protein GGD62_005747 [Bradyrhizobium sp. ERR14]|nr:hypothetical protein [Bradyrhizobium sp. ERR14]